MILGRESYCQTKGEPENVTAGNYSSIAEDCYFHYGDNHICVENRNVVFTTNWQQSMKVEPIEIGNDVWIGRGVKFLQGVKVGDGAIVGAWAVVAKDVPPYSVFVGNPGRVKKYRFEKDQIKKLLKMKWWDWSPETVNERKPDMLNINIFLEKYS